MDAGTPIGLKFANGVTTTFAGNNNTIADELQDDVHLYIIFAEDNLEEKLALGSGRGKKGKKWSDTHTRASALVIYFR